MEQNLNQPNPQPSKYSLATLLITALLAIAVTFGITYWYLRPTQENTTPTSPATTPETTSVDTFSTADYRYIVKDINPLKATWDQQIVRVNKKTKAETVLVPSVKTALPELKKAQNLVLEEFAQPYDSTVVIYTKILSESDGSPSILFSLDTKTGKLTKMKINDFTGDNYSVTNYTVLSPDKSKLAVIPYQKSTKGAENKLYIADLLHDSYKEVVTLKAGETFNAGFMPDASAECSFDCPTHYEVEWIDDYTLHYAVYDQSKKPNPDTLTPAERGDLLSKIDDQPYLSSIYKERRSYDTE